LLGAIESLSERIYEYNQRIGKIAKESYPQVARLEQVKGVGTLIALVFVLIIGPRRSVSVWQADRELSGTGAVGGLQRTAATAGTHHQTRQLSFGSLEFPGAILLRNQ
jgi:hypothetical protein